MLIDIRAYGQYLAGGVVGAQIGKMTPNNADIAHLNGVTVRELVLSEKVEGLRIGGLEVILPSLELQATAA